jgi:hypothetical protein
MKRLFTLCLLIGIANVSKAQLFVEDFDYTSTDIVNNNWSVHSGTTDPVATTTGLTYTGYVSSGIGNAANVAGAGYDYNQPLSSAQSTNGTVIYTSLLVKFTEAGTTALTGGYFFHLGNRVTAANFTSFCARLWAKMDATGNINLGITNSSTAAYTSTNYALNTTYLIIIKYTINTGGNDEILMWVKNAGVPANEVAAGTPDVTLTTEAGLDAINALAIRQTTNIPDVVVDGIRVGNTWNTSIMPLSLKNFNASLINNKASLTWSTSNEINVKGFSIERSTDGSNFTEAGFVKASNGTSNQYSFNDAVTIIGTTYFRLKMLDKDGSFKYSQVVVLNSKKSIKLDVYPNPVTNTITLSHTKADNTASIKIVTVEGRTIATYNVQAGATQTSIDATKLTRGNYLVVFENEGAKSTSQFIKQ